MYRKGFIFFLLLLFMPLFLCAERPYFGVEGGIFFPRGDWEEELDFTPCFKITMQKKIVKMLSAGISIGSLSFSRKYTSEVKLSMFPVVYVDIIAEKQLKKSPVYLGIFLGSNYSYQKITYGEGEESATVWGWNGGGLISFQFNFIIKPYLKGRYISRKDTDGLEFVIGINL